MPAHEAPHHAAEEDMLAAAIGSEVRGLLLSPCSFKLLDFNTDFDSHMRSHPDEPHLASGVVTFLGDFSRLS